MSRGMLIIKILNNSVSLNKLIMMPFELKDSEYWKIHPFKDVF
jgi:hypothetical protein